MYVCVFMCMCIRVFLCTCKYMSNCLLIHKDISMEI